jgi:16S rRNA (adenine1518-N6/adenine1519-N6)-dimethyltransferase
MEEKELIEFENFLKKAFSQRRKKLKSNLKLKNYPEEISEYMEKRAEELSPEKLLKLFYTVRDFQLHQ